MLKANNQFANNQSEFITYNYNDNSKTKVFLFYYFYSSIKIKIINEIILLKGKKIRRLSF